MNAIRKFIIIIIVILFAVRTAGQQKINWPTPEVEQMYQQAREYLSRGNLRQAIVTYQQAIPLAPAVMVLRRDLAQAYILSGNYEQANKLLEELIKNGKADEQCYQLQSNSYAAQGDAKKAASVIGKGLDKFPRSGLLYHEQGKLHDDIYEQEEALKSWLDGIAADPGYRVNYYEAARTYMLTDKPVWAIIYAEVFVDMEQQTPRANETRKLLLNAYKKFFYTPATADMPEFGKDARVQAKNFEDAVTITLRKLAPVVSDGITTENLVMLRTRFLMDWQTSYAQRYPFTLFAFQDSLLRNGGFDVYNQWLLGRAENQQQYDAWNKFHEGEIAKFEAQVREHRLQPVAGDAYNDRKLKNIFPKKKN
jgi:FimV-like protein